MGRNLGVRLGTLNNVVVATSTVAVASTAFASGTSMIRVCSPAACFIKIDAAPTAAATDIYIPANVVEYITVSPGQKISVFTTTLTPTVSIVEVSG